MVHLLVVQPSAVNPPERLGEWLTDAGASLTVISPATDGVPLTLDGYDAVVCLGGEMGAMDDEEHPWLPDLRRLLSDAVARRVPVLAICLGAQLLAVATGGGVRRIPDGPEAGPWIVGKRDAANNDPLFAPMPFMPDVLQFHHDEVHQLPPGAVLLASAPRCGNQAFRVGPCAYGLQFHIEPSVATLLHWVERDERAAAVIPASRLEPDNLADVHATMAEVWGGAAARFVALASGELDAAGAAPSPDGRRMLDLLG